MNYLDIETDLSAPVNANIVCAYLNGKVYERRKLGDEGMKALFQSIEGTVCGHNIKFDAKAIYLNFGVLLEDLWCTWVAAKMLRNGKKNADGSPVSNALPSVLEYYLGVHEKVHEGKKDIRTNFSLKRDITPKEEEYIIADGKHLPELQRRLALAIEEDKMRLAFTTEMALIPVLIKKEAKGVRIDREKLKWLASVWQRGKRLAVHLLDKELVKVGARNKKPTLFITYDYGSTKQVSGIFKDLGLPVPKKTVIENKKKITKESNEEDVLNEYLYEYPNSPLKRFIEIYLWFQECSKLVSTYGEKMLDLVDENGYLHTEYNQLGAETSRLSSSGPNLQNLPASGHGAKVRNCFIPDDGNVFVDADMDGAEIRIAADFCGDALLTASIKDGVDMHSKLASGTYSVLAGHPVEISKSTKPIKIHNYQFIPLKVRDRHKSVTFSFFYLGGPQRVYTIIGGDVRALRPDVKQACQEVYNELANQLPVLTAFLKSKVREATDRGFLRGPKFNRIRFFDKNAYGNAANNNIQMCNAEAIKVAMIRMDRWLTETGYGRLVLNVHDQLVISCRPEYQNEVAAKTKEVMTDSLSYFLSNIKGSSSVKITKVWEK
jgi:DNA polymerase-1